MKKLRECRIHIGANQAEVAQKLSITVPTLSNYENGAVLPTVEDMVNAENLYDQQIDWSGFETIGQGSKQTVMSAIIALSQRYPLQAVLNFVQRAMKIDQKRGSPDRIISHYAQLSYRIEPLPLSGDQFNKCV